MSIPTLEYHKNRTRNFRDSPNILTFIDGEMVTSLNVADNFDQNRDYNAWKCDVFRKLFLIWDNNGRKRHSHSLRLIGHVEDER